MEIRGKSPGCDGSSPGADEIDERPGVHLDLHADLTGTEYNGIQGKAALVQHGDKLLFHADGGAAAPDIAGELVDVRHMDHLHRLFPDTAGSRFEIQFGCHRDHEYIVFPAVSHCHQGLVDLFHRQTGLLGDSHAVHSSAVIFIGMDRVGQFCLIQRTDGVGLFQFFLCHESGFLF